MANKKPQSNHRCGECKLGVPVMKHEQLDLNGNPITVRCPHSEWARVRSEMACEHFKQ